MSQVSEVDRLKVAERVRRSIAPIFGGTPGYKRRRGIYRALKRGDLKVLHSFTFELLMLNTANVLAKDLYK